MKNFLNGNKEEVVKNIKNYKKIVEKLSQNQVLIDGHMGLDLISLQIRQDLVKKNNKIKESIEFIEAKKEFNRSMYEMVSILNEADPEIKNEYALILLYDFDSGAREACEKISSILKQLE